MQAVDQLTIFAFYNNNIITCKTFVQIYSLLTKTHHLHTRSNGALYKKAITFVSRLLFKLPTSALPFLFNSLYLFLGKVCTALGTVIIRTVPNIQAFRIFVCFFFKTRVFTRFVTPFLTYFFCC